MDQAVVFRFSDRLLTRRPIIAGTIAHVGKEANRIDDRESGTITSDDRDHRFTYRTPDPRPWPDTLARLYTQSIATLAADAGISERRLRDILKARTTLRPRLKQRLQALADGLANTGS